VTDAQSNLKRLVRLAQDRFPDVLVVPYAASAETLGDHGLQAELVPIGSGLRHCVDLGLERDIDVLFIGALDVPRRRRLIRKLQRTGLNVVAVGDWSNPELFGKGRSRLLNRTRILLNLARFPGQLSGHRFVLGMGAGALVLSEPVYRPAPSFRRSTTSALRSRRFPASPSTSSRTSRSVWRSRDGRARSSVRP
jgi:hypothetical protein